MAYPGHRQRKRVRISDGYLYYARGPSSQIDLSYIKLDYRKTLDSFNFDDFFGGFEYLRLLAVTCPSTLFCVEKIIIFIFVAF